MSAKKLLSVAVGALTLAGAVVATPAVADDDTQGPSPVVGSVLTGSTTDDIGPIGTLTLHAVRRLPGATVVYFSIGSAQKLPGFNSPATFTTTRFVEGTVLRGISSDAILVDRAHRMVYAPLTHDGDGCVVCSDRVTPQWTIGTPVNVAAVGYVGVPPLPDDVHQVDVIVGNRVFTNVDVGDGPLEPTVTFPDNTTANGPWLGRGWPKVDLSALSRASDPKVFSIHRMSVNSTTDDVHRRVQPGHADYDLSASVLFDKDKAVVKPAGVDAIKALAGQIKNSARGAITVTGYTDNLGSSEHGLVLSRQRAAAVATVLKPLLPVGVTMTTVGRGEADPIASNDTEAGREQNRRVTISVKGA